LGDFRLEGGKEISGGGAISEMTEAKVEKRKRLKLLSSN